MMLDITTLGMLKINMTLYVKKMIEAFPENPKEKTQCPCSKIYSRWTEHQQNFQKTRYKYFTPLL
jgi:hypothetical protein